MLRKKSPISEKQQELDALEEDIRRKMENLQKLIEDAPVREEENRRQRREMLMETAARGGRLDAPSSLHSKTLHAHTITRRAPRLKSEQKAQRIRFITLFLVLGILTILLLSKLSEAL